MSTGKNEPARVDLGLEIALTRLQLGDLLVDRVELEERRLHLLGGEDRAQGDDQPDDHSGGDRDDRGRIAGANPEEAEPFSPDLVADPVADVRHRPRERHHRGDVSDPANDLDEVHTSAARRNRVRPIAVKRMFGTHAQSHANARNASPANEQTVMTT